MTNNVDPVGAVCSGSKLFAFILISSVMLGNYLQQTTSADDIFRCIFLGALRVKCVRSLLKRHSQLTEKNGSDGRLEVEFWSETSIVYFYI